MNTKSRRQALRLAIRELTREIDAIKRTKALVTRTGKVRSL